MPSGVTGNAAASDAEDSRFESLEGSVIDWNSKKTSDLILILESLARFQKNAKTSREIENTKRNISAISKILKKRKRRKEK